MSTPIIITVYCLCIVAASLLGGYLPRLVRLTHTRIQTMMSAVGGLMLGIGLFHLLPHAVGPAVSLDRAIWWMMAGLLITFLLMRAFHAHQHAPPEGDLAGETSGNEDRQQSHDHAHGTTAPHDHDHHEHSRGAKHSWLGIFLGLSLHTLLDGVALAASAIHDAQHAPNMMLPGFAVFLGVLLHKPLDSLSITTLMSASGWSLRLQQVVNFSYAVMCPLGATLFYFGVQRWAEHGATVGCALAFAAGIFVCIALADLLPEVQFHAHDRLKLTTALLVGVALAYAIGFLEPAHVHDHAAPATDDDQQHGEQHEHDEQLEHDAHRHHHHDH